MLKEEFGEKPNNEDDVIAEWISQDERIKILQNQQEDYRFEKSFNDLFNRKGKINQPLVIGTTPYTLSICGARENLQLTIRNCQIIT